MELNAAILEGLFQLSDVGILTTDEHLTVTAWSRWLEVHSGRRAEDVIGKNLLELFPDIAARRLDRHYYQALEGQLIVLSQGLHGYLLPMPSPGGRPYPMRQSVRISPVPEQGTIVGTLTLIENVTERVAAEMELRDRANQQAALAGLTQQALAGGDEATLQQAAVTRIIETLQVHHAALLNLLPDRRILQVRAERGPRGSFTGTRTMDAGPQSPGEYVLRSDWAVVIPDLRQESRFAPDAGWVQRGLVSVLATRIMEGSQPRGLLEVATCEPRAFTEDNIQFVQAVAHVLGLAAHRKRLESELRDRVAALADADRRKDEFLAMLGHELRNPLAPIRNAARVFHIKELADPDVGWAVGVIDRQVQHMTRLIDDLLDISRITRGKINFHKQPVELAAVVARAVETTRPLIDARKHRFTLNLPTEPLRLEADAARLAQVIGNLLTNAAKFTPDSGAITLTAAREGTEIVIRVRDTGLGIPAEMLPSVFDLFTQGERSLDRSEGGLGIGLTLVRSLLALHDGTVEAYSAGPGQGSEFVVRLPALPANIQASDLTAVPPNHAACAIKPRRILVVDDNQDSAESLAMLLRLSGHEVQTAYDGPAALEAAASFRPAVVLLDIGLPRMSGVEVAHRLRQNPANNHILTIAMTGYGQDSDRRKSKEAGFDAHLVKPIDYDELQDLVARHGVRSGESS